MILQPIKHASLLLSATVGLMGCLYLTPKNHLSFLTSWSYYLGCPDGKLYATCSQNTPHILTRPKKIWSYVDAVGRKVGWTTIFGNCMRECYNRKIKHLMAFAMEQ